MYEPADIIYILLFPRTTLLCFDIFQRQYMAFQTSQYHWYCIQGTINFPAIAFEKIDKWASRHVNSAKWGILVHLRIHSVTRKWRRSVGGGTEKLLTIKRTHWEWHTIVKVSITELEYGKLQVANLILNPIQNGGKLKVDPVVQNSQASAISDLAYCSPNSISKI